MIITPKALSETLRKYEERFGHSPSPETYKFRTDTEIDQMANKALLENKPVDDWKSRPFKKTGTILDTLYDDSETPDAVENTQSSGKVKKIPKKELRKIAIAKEEARQWLAKREKQAKKDNSKKTTETFLPEKSTPPARDYSITHSNAQNLNWEVEKARSEQNYPEVDETKVVYTQKRVLAEIYEFLKFLFHPLILYFLIFYLFGGFFYSVEVGIAGFIYISVLLWLSQKFPDNLARYALWFFLGAPITAVLVAKLIG